MLNEENSFYITLSSNGSTDYYPENSLSRFTVKLPHTLHLDKNVNWCVGLHSAAYTNFKRRDTQNVTIRIDDMYTTFINTSATVFTMISSSELFLKNLLKDIKNKFFFQKYEKVNFIEIPVKDVDTKKYVVMEYVKDKPICLERHIEYTQDKLFNFIYSQIPLSGRRKVSEDFLKMIEYPSNKELFKGVFKEKIVNATHNIFFYIDIIKPQIINNNLARVLYIKPIESSYRENNEYSIQNIQYQNVEKFQINEISVMLTDEYGSQINFEEGMKCTLIVLHFLKGI